MAAEIRETEKKYEFESGAVLPSLHDLPLVAQESELAGQTLDAEYYDTAGLRLLHGGVTLRRRRGGSDQGWHLKLPADGDSRREIRLPLGRSGRHVPAELATLVRAYARGEPLRPVALITTTRRRRALLDGAGNSLAEVATDDVSSRTMGESTTLTHWCEVEVELTGGGQRLLKAADKRLRHSGLRPAGYSAKLARALAGQLPALDPMIRRDEYGSVHRMRVATRRLRSTLKSFGKVLGTPGIDRLRIELKWLGGVLGAARDNEVLAPHLHARVAEVPVEQVIGPVQARVTAYFAPRAASARTALLEVLDSERYIALLNDLDQLLSALPAAAKARRPAEDIPPAAVRHACRRVRRRVRRARLAPAGHPREIALHETRKAAKDARYAAEAARPADGKKARCIARRMRKIQAVLGDHHDAVVARDTARDNGMRAHLAGENAFSFGLLHEGYQRDALILEKQAVAEWRRGRVRVTANGCAGSRAKNRDGNGAVVSLARTGRAG